MLFRSTVPEINTTSSPATTTTKEQSTAQSEIKPTVQPTAQPAATAHPTTTVQSTSDSPASDNCEEISPVMGERAFYNRR